MKGGRSVDRSETAAARSSPPPQPPASQRPSQGSGQGRHGHVDHRWAVQDCPALRISELAQAALTSLPGTEDLWQLSAGVWITSGSRLALSINPFACGMSGPARVSSSWRVIGRMYALSTSVSQGSSCCQEAETAWSVSGRCQPGSHCRYSRGTRTASIMRFLMRVRAEPSQVGGTGRSDCGTSARGAA